MKIIRTIFFVAKTYVVSLGHQIKYWSSSLFGKSVADEIVETWKKLEPVSTNLELVRVGPGGDGGYLVPEDYMEVDAVFSPGVSDESGFELQMANLGIECFLADASVRGPAEQHPLINFEPKFLGAENHGQFITLENWISSYGKLDRLKLLQMDIEGYEWEVLDQTPITVIKTFKIIVIELHDLNRLTNTEFRERASRVLSKLLSTHEVLHVHGNNNSPSLQFRKSRIPQVLEVTLHHKEGIEVLGSRVAAHELDSKNSKWLPNAKIRFE